MGKVEKKKPATKKAGGKKTDKKTKKKMHPGKMTLSVASMLIWVAASVIVSQYAIGYLLLWMIGAEASISPVGTAIYTALSYTLAMVLVVLVPALASAIKRSKEADKGAGGGRNARRDTAVGQSKTTERSKATKRNEVVGQGKTAGSGKHLSVKIEWKTLGLWNWPKWTDVGLAPVGFIVYLLLAAGLVALFNLFPWFDVAQTQDVGFSYYVSGFNRTLAFFTLVVIAPIAEEIIFRGWLYGKMREKIASEYSNTVSMIISILLVSILFGAVHMQWNVGVNVFALSIVLCGLREITGTIYAGIFLHMLKNGVAFWLLFMM